LAANVRHAARTQSSRELLAELDHCHTRRRARQGLEDSQRYRGGQNDFQTKTKANEVVRKETRCGKMDSYLRDWVCHLNVSVHDHEINTFHAVLHHPQDL